MQVPRRIGRQRRRHQRVVAGINAGRKFLGAGGLKWSSAVPQMPSSPEEGTWTRSGSVFRLLVPAKPPWISLLATVAVGARMGAVDGVLLQTMLLYRVSEPFTESIAELPPAGMSFWVKVQLIKLQVEAVL